VITKDLCTYSIRNLHQEQSLRDHLGKRKDEWPYIGNVGLGCCPGQRPRGGEHAGSADGCRRGGWAEARTGAGRARRPGNSRGAGTSAAGARARAPQ
jgi:hypothetical protein